VSQLSLGEPSESGPSEAVTLKLVVAYDGTDFRGFAAQPDQRTVAGEIAPVLERVLGHDVQLSCAGRTDSGVHAWGQVVSCAVGASTDPAVLQRAINAHLAPEVVVRSAELVDGEFDARRSAQWRTYRYTILRCDVPDPFRARYVWWVPEALDLPRMRMASDPFLGAHDFSSFCRKRPGASTTTRRVLASEWRDEGDGVLVYEIRATAFCWQMVRSIVGTLADVGIGKIRPGDILAILRARDRTAAGRLAPPNGLCLWDVGYELGTVNR
jgi:tRNA pseudouridine38-40 synthase